MTLGGVTKVDVHREAVTHGKEVGAHDNDERLLGKNWWNSDTEGLSSRLRNEVVI